MRPTKTHILPLTGTTPIARRPQSLTDQIHERLREEILNATRRPGEQVIEEEVSTRFGVSRTPVREALRQLSQQGWVITMPRKGYLVRPLRLDDIREVFELRLLIEPGLFAHAAKWAVTGQLVELRELITADRRGSGDADAAIPDVPGREFHLAVARLSGNSRTIGILIGLLDEVRRLRLILSEMPTHPSVSRIDDHRMMLDAIESGDADRVQMLARDHIQSSADMIMDAFRLSLD